MSRFSILRLRAFWRRVSPLDIVALGIIVAYALARVARSIGISFPFSGLLGLLFVLALAYFVFRLTPWVRNKLLWSLRNRLIVAYIFIAVVPVVLLLTMAGVASYLLYMQLGAHMLRDDVQGQIGALEAASQAVKVSVVDEATGKPVTDPSSILTRPSVVAVIAEESRELPGLRVHADSSRRLLERSGGAGARKFTGMVESGGQLWLRCTTLVDAGHSTFPLSLSVPISSDTLDALSSELGPIHLTILRPGGAAPAQSLMLEIDGRDYVPAEEIASRRRSIGPRANWVDAAVTGGLTWEAILLNSETDDPQTVPVLAAFSVRPSSLNRRLFSSLGAIGPLLTFTLVVTGIIFLLLEAAALATGVVLTRRITSAVSELYLATHYVRRGDFSHRVRVQKRDQLGVLGESFNEMTSSVGELIEEQKKRQKLENEISIAQEVQAQLFPQTIPKVEGVEVAAICRAARVVSGDYYDFIRLGPRRLGIAVADISGKGISAALLMASLQAALRSQAVLDGTGGTANLVARLNTHLFYNTLDDRYATFFYGIYDSFTQTLEYTNAGHCAPFFVVGDKITKLEVGGTVVGLFADASYVSDTIKATPDSLLVAFSDGLIEPENVYGEEFGTQRMMDEVLRHRNAPLDKLAANLIDAAEQWSGTAEQADDMTVVVARLDIAGAGQSS
ncbi:MAG: SpoIIE family protein phosphatase [Candidatus Acidiferrales bacterium]